MPEFKSLYTNRPKLESLTVTFTREEIDEIARVYFRLTPGCMAFLSVIRRIEVELKQEGQCPSLN